MSRTLSNNYYHDTRRQYDGGNEHEQEQDATASQTKEQQAGALE